jgi:acid phosphatase type 7
MGLAQALGVLARRGVSTRAADVTSERGCGSRVCFSHGYVAFVARKSTMNISRGLSCGSLALCLMLLPVDLFAQGSASAAPEDCEAGQQYKSPPKIIRGPFLQQVTRESVVVRWDTNRASNSVVKFGLDGATRDRSVCDFASTTHHETLVTGLTAGEHYEYVARSNGAETPAFSFRAAAAQDQPYSFVVYGDNQSNPDIHEAVANAALATDPDFFLNTGDIVSDGKILHQYDTRFFEPAYDLLARTPFFVSIGNHENEDDNYFDLLSLPGNEHWYAITVGNARILALDTNLDYSPGSEQYAWLEDQLERAHDDGSEWLVVFNHKPAWCNGWDSPGYDGEVLERTTLVPLYEHYHVDVVFNGHAHDYEHGTKNGVTYIINGGGGGALDTLRNSFPWITVYESTHHFVHVSADAATMHITAIRPDGSFVDDFTLSH